MPAIDKIRKKDTNTVDPNIRDDIKSPAFDKKNQLATDFINKYGLPERYYDKKKK